MTPPDTPAAARPSGPDAPGPAPDVLCIGSVLWDIIGRTSAHMTPGADVPGRITRLPGGVAMNIAATLARFGMRPAVLTAIGQDRQGADLVAAAEGLGVSCRHAYRSEDLPTDRYMAIEAPGGLVAAIADAHSLEAAGARILRPLIDGPLGCADAPFAGPVALDGNLTTALLRRIAADPAFAAADLRVAPASPGKAERLAALIGHPGAIFYVNLAEAEILAGARFASAAEGAAGLLARGVRRALVTDGARAAADGAAEGVIEAAPPRVLATRITGAGDTFMAAHLVAERRGADRPAALSRALEAAARHVSGDVPT